MAKELFDILTFDYAKIENIDITTTDPDWTDLLNLNTPARPPGVYALKFSLQFHLNSTSQSFIYQFSMDGGATWGYEYQKEVKDRSNVEIIEVLNILETVTEAPIQVACRVTREGSANCTVIKCVLSCERKQ